MKKQVWRIYYGDRETVATATAEEHSALEKWHGESRVCELEDLAKPTYADLAASKKAAYKAALSAWERESLARMGK